MSTTKLKAVTGVANPPAQKPQTLAGMLSDPAFKQQLAHALPRHMTPDRMARIALTELRKTPALMKCDPKSFLGAVVQTAQLGLEPGNSLGHAYILPYGTQAQLIIGYRGMIDLARRSGQIVSLSAHTVHANDEFAYSYGLHEDLRHIPASGERGPMTHVYAVARLKDGGIQFEVMSRVDVEGIKAQSKASKSGPWVTHFDEMAKKTVIRRLFKYLPVSIEMQRAVGLDESGEAGVDQGNAYVIDGELAEEVEQIEDHNADALDQEQEDGLRAVEQASEQMYTYADIADKLHKAKSMDELNEAADLIQHVGNIDHQEELSRAFKARMNEINGK